MAINPIVARFNFLFNSIYTVEQKIESCYDGIDCHCVVLGTLDVGSVLINAVIKADDLSCLVAHACTKFVSLEPSVI